MLNIDSGKCLYHPNNKVKGFIEEINGNNYLTLIPTDVSKDTLKPYQVLRNSTKDLVKVIINNTAIMMKKNMKIKFNSDDDLSLKKTRKLYKVVIIG